MELFWKKGFHATSMQDLVDHLGINRASLYDTFGGKQELFDLAFQAYIARNQAWVKSFFKNTNSVRESLKLFFYSAVDAALADKDRKGCFVVNTAAEMIPGDRSELEQCICQNKDGFEANMRELLQIGVDQGEISKDKDLKAIASALFTLNAGLQVVGKMESDRDVLYSIVDQTLSMLN